MKKAGELAQFSQFEIDADIATLARLGVRSVPELRALVRSGDKWQQTKLSLMSKAAIEKTLIGTSAFFSFSSSSCERFDFGSQLSDGA